MKRILVISGLIMSVAIMVALVAIYFFPHVLWIHYARYSFPRSKNALLYDRPIERTPSPTLDKEIAGNQSFEYGDFVFQTTWPKAKKIEKNLNRFGWVDIHFTDSKRLILMGRLRGRGPTFAEEVLEEIDSDFIADVVFGKPRTRSNYSIHKQILEYSLDDTPSNRADMVRMMTLGVLKAVSYPVVGDSDTLFSFETDTIKGWQIGKPGKKRAVLLVFYDRQDRPYELLCRRMTQREIDTIINTMSEP